MGGAVKLATNSCRAVNPGLGVYFDVLVSYVRCNYETHTESFI